MVVLNLNRVERAVAEDFCRLEPSLGSFAQADARLCELEVWAMGHR